LTSPYFTTRRLNSEVCITSLRETLSTFDFISLTLYSHFSSAQKLWEKGIVPSYDGKIWRLHGYEGKIIWSDVRIKDEYTVEGYRQTKGWGADRKVYFVMVFSKPVVSYGLVNDENFTYKGFGKREKWLENYPHKFGRKLKAYFNSTIAYIVIVEFLIISGWFFASNVFLANVASLRIIFEVIPLLLIFFIPAVTMRLFSEEQKAGTIEILLTKPVNDIDIIVGKFLSAWILLGVALIPTIFYYLTITFVGKVDIGPVIGGYLGLLLMGGVYVSIGIFSSSLTENQVVAFIIGFLIIFILFMLDKILPFVPGFVVPIFEYLSIDYHFSNIARGVIDTRDLIYYLSSGYLFILLTQVSLEKRKW